MKQHAPHTHYHSHPLLFLRQPCTEAGTLHVVIPVLLNGATIITSSAGLRTKGREIGWSKVTQLVIGKPIWFIQKAQFSQVLYQKNCIKSYFVQRTARCWSSPYFLLIFHTCSSFSLEQRSQSCLLAQIWMSQIPVTLRMPSDVKKCHCLHKAQ